MKRRIPILLLLILAACVTGTQQPKRTPLEQAKLAYVDTSLGYEFAMQTAKQLLAAGKLSNAQWQQVYAAQEIAQAAQPIIRGMLNLWSQSGVKPADYDAAVKQLTNAAGTVTQINTEANH